MGIEFQVDLTGSVTENAKKAAAALASMAPSAKIIKTEMGALEEKIAKAQALGKPFAKLSKDLELAQKAFHGLPPAMQAVANSEQKLIEAVKLGEQAMKASELESKKLGAEQAALAKETKGITAELKEGWVGAAKAVGAAVVAMITTFAAFVVAGAAFAIESTMAKEKLLGLLSAMGGSKAAGAATYEMLGSLSNELGVTRASLVETTKAFQAMGITNLGELREQIKATAGITAVMGEEGAAAYEKIIAKTKLAIDTGAKFVIKDKAITQFRQMGLSVEDIAKKMGMTSKALEQGLNKGTIDAKKFQAALGEAARSKFGEALAEQALEPTNLWAKFKEKISGLFSGIEVKPFLQSIQQLTNLFGTDKASGKAMKAGITATFNAVFAVAKKVVDWLQGALLHVEIWVLKAIIAFKHWHKEFNVLDSKYGIVKKLVPILEVLAVGFGVIAAAAVLGVGAVLAFTAACALIIAALVGAVSYVIKFSVSLGEGIGEGIGKAIDWLTQFAPKTVAALADWIQAGATAAGNFIDGIVDGIKAGVMRVVDAAKGMATSAVAAVTGAFQSHSPSIVMHNVGKLGFAGGLALGIASGEPQVAEASQQVASAAVGTVGQQVGNVAPPQASPAAAPVASAGGGGSSSSSSTSTENHFHFGPGSLAVHGGGKSAEAITEELVAQVFERMALEQGT